jgi:DNA polymerase-1
VHPCRPPIKEELVILAIDGNNVAFVANAISRLSTKNGFPTQGLFGFLKSLHHFASRFKPEKIFVAWDGGRSKRRMEICPEYKENRKEKTPEQEMMFEELKMQFPVIKEAVLHLGLTSIFGWGVEGDDLIALLARKTAEMGKDIVIVSSDKDFLQLVNPQVSVYSATSRKVRHITHENMKEVYGLSPEQWLDFRALVGDSSDNIGGVKGVGEKTATDLLNAYGSLENFFEGAPREKKLLKRHRAVLENAETIERNRRMMDLKTPAATFKGVSIERRGPDHSALRSMFLEYELKEFYLNFNGWVSAFNGGRST